MAIDQDVLVEALQDPAFYDHPVAEVQLVETHISLVFLAGAYAYKIKKPYNLNFLDFSTLAKRHHYCLEELRLNRRFTPGLYLDVAPIGQAGNRLILGQEPAVEYAVKMQRFPHEMQLDQLCEDGRLDINHFRRFATTLAGIHRRAPVLSAEGAFDPDRRILAPALQNFEQLRPLIDDADRLSLLNTLEQWSRDRYRLLLPTLQSRLRDGSIRECHGDIHLGNMVMLAGEPSLFDCIEFSDCLRWIDVMNDCAFLLMDLDDRDRSLFGWGFLDHYLQQTGDYAGMTLLPFYKIYRAMVRAKVGYLRLTQAEPGSPEANEHQLLADSYLDLAARYMQPGRPGLILTHGLSGSGKTTFVTELAPQLQAICLHSDVERKRLHDLDVTARSGSKPGAGLYSAEANRQTYTRLRQLAGQILEAGVAVIVDATFIRKHHRKQFFELATELRVPLKILDFQVDREELQRRVAARQRLPDSVSEATTAVLDYQLGQEERLDETEQKQAVAIGPETSVQSVAHRLLTDPQRG